MLHTPPPSPHVACGMWKIPRTMYQMNNTVLVLVLVYSNLIMMQKLSQAAPVLDVSDRGHIQPIKPSTQPYGATHHAPLTTPPTSPATPPTAIHSRYLTHHPSHSTPQKQHGVPLDRNYLGITKL